MEILRRFPAFGLPFLVAAAIVAPRVAAANPGYHTTDLGYHATDPSPYGGPTPNGHLRPDYYYAKDWPYADDPPFVKIPAIFAAGAPLMPATLALFPYTWATQKRGDPGLAFIEAETLYMETPGYAIYVAVGYPLHLAKYVVWDGPAAIFESLFGSNNGRAKSPETLPDRSPDNLP